MRTDFYTFPNGGQSCQNDKLGGRLKIGKVIRDFMYIDNARIGLSPAEQINVDGAIRWVYRKNIIYLILPPAPARLEVLSLRKSSEGKSKMWHFWPIREGNS